MFKYWGFLISIYQAMLYSILIHIFLFNSIIFVGITTKRERKNRVKVISQSSSDSEESEPSSKAKPTKATLKKAPPKAKAAPKETPTTKKRQRELLEDVPSAKRQKQFFHLNMVAFDKNDPTPPTLLDVASLKEFTVIELNVFLFELTGKVSKKVAHKSARTAFKYEYEALSGDGRKRFLKFLTLNRYDVKGIKASV